MSPWYRDGEELEFDEALGQTGDDPYVRHLPEDDAADLFEHIVGMHLIPDDEDDLALECFLEDADV
jgi:hypothetical protein